jgi:hypothetical protein
MRGGGFRIPASESLADGSASAKQANSDGRFPPAQLLGDLQNLLSF